MLRVRSVVSLVRASHTAAANREQVKSLQREATKNTVRCKMRHNLHTTHVNVQPNKRGQSAGKKFMLARINGILNNTTVGIYQSLNLNAGGCCNWRLNHSTNTCFQTSGRRSATRSASLVLKCASCPIG